MCICCLSEGKGGNDVMFWGQTGIGVLYTRPSEHHERIICNVYTQFLLNVQIWTAAFTHYLLKVNKNAVSSLFRISFMSFVTVAKLNALSANLANIPAAKFVLAYFGEVTESWEVALDAFAFWKLQSWLLLYCIITVMTGTWLSSVLFRNQKFSHNYSIPKYASANVQA